MITIFIFFVVKYAFRLKYEASKVFEVAIKFNECLV
jgi:hypothetical protein